MTYPWYAAIPMVYIELGLVSRPIRALGSGPSPNATPPSSVPRLGGSLGRSEHHTISKEQMMRYCIYVYNQLRASVDELRFNACFTHDDRGLERAIAEADWYATHGYGVIVMSRSDDLSRYIPPIVELCDRRPIVVDGAVYMIGCDG